MLKRLSNHKKFILISFITVLGFFLAVLFVQAQTIDTGLSYAAETGLGTQDIRITIANIIRVLLGILGLVAVVIIIYGGFLYMTAAGEVEKVKTAKKLLTGAIIGLIIVLSSFALASFVVGRLQEAAGPGGEPGGPSGGPEPYYCEGIGCYPPPGYCLDPLASSPESYICSISPDTGKIGDFVTIKGGKFLEYDEQSSQVVFVKAGEEYPAQIVLCGDSLSWNDNQIVVEVPGNLPFSETESNLFRINVITVSGSSQAKPIGGLKPSNGFTLEVGQPGPGIACIVPASGKENTAIEVQGKRFGPDQGKSELIFKENIEASVSSWTDLLLQSIVPPDSISGDVKVTVDDDDSNGYYFTVPCDEDGDCASGCCYQSWGGKSCAESTYCLPGPGQSCDPDPETKEICEAGGECQTNLVCDAIQCTCRYPQSGDPCDSDTEVAECQVDNNKCGPGLFCSETTCSCQELPQIKNVVPNDGAPGNYITILGQGFGEIDPDDDLPATGQVYFCGEDKNNNQEACDNDGDDQLAQFPYEINPLCDISGCWKNNQVIVVVPDLAVSGPIKITTVSGLADQTNDANGIQLSDFTVNDIKRPSICALEPDEGSFGIGLNISGAGFGTEIKEALIGGESFGFLPDRNNWDWTENFIDWLSVPNINPGILPVQVKIDTIFSNPFNFTVLPVAEMPQIDYIDPGQGPTGQFITIFGKNFGYAIGEVRFDNQEANMDNWALADTNFPNECQSEYWHDNYIVVKVPDYQSLPASNIVVRTASKLYSNATEFSHMATGTPSPGICAIIPNQGPVGTEGITLYGENFGSYTANQSKVTFYEDQEISQEVAGFWTNLQVGSGQFGQGPLAVPGLAQTGPVQLTNQGRVSNQIRFEVSDCRLDAGICKNNMECCSNGVCQEQCPVVETKECIYEWSFMTGRRSLVYGPPQVVEDPACIDNIQSPSPWKNSRDNCANALIAARFIQHTDEGMIKAQINPATLVAANIIVRACGTGDDFIQENCLGQPLAAESIEYESEILSNGSVAANSFIFNPVNLLQQNTWYQVTLKSDPLTNIGIRTINNVYLDGDRDAAGLEGGDYVWQFKIRDSADACPVDNIVVSPPEARMTLLTQTQEYNSYPLASNCNVLNPGDYEWTWWKRYTNGFDENAEALLEGYGTALITPKEGFIGTHKKIAIPKKQGLVYVAANIFPNDPLLYKEDTDNRLVVDLNIPEITGFSPKDGLIRPEVNSYVTITGRNFGVSQGNSMIYFDDVAAQLSDCATAWSDTEIKVIAPKPTATAPSKEKTFAWPLTNVKDGMVLYYNFEEDSRVLVEDKVGNSTGEIKGGQRVNDQFGRAFSFNGTSDYIRADNKTGIDSGSLEMWFKPAIINNTQVKTLLSGNTVTGDINASLDINPAMTAKAWKNFQWNHLVYTYDSDNEEQFLYINGYKFFPAQFAAIGISGNGRFIDTESTEIVLGGKIGIGASFYPGLIDGFAIYDKVLSQEEVWDNYGLKTGQILLLEFEGVGDQIVDSSANNWTDLVIANSGLIFRTDEGKYGKAITFNKDNRIIVTNNPSLVFAKEITAQGWFKISDAEGQPIIASNNIRLHIIPGPPPVLRFFLPLADAAGNTAQYYTQVNMPVNPQWYSQWHYFAAVYDGEKMKIFLDSDQNQYEVSGDINQTGSFGNVYIGGSQSHNVFRGSLDSIAIYNRALTDEEIYSNFGAKDNSWIKVVTSYGEDNTDFDNDNVKDPGETFRLSENVYPFLCQLIPNYGEKGITVDIEGDNLGDSNKTVYQGKDYGVGSYLRLYNDVLMLMSAVTDFWNNTAISYKNPLEDLQYPETVVRASIDPYSEPYNDLDNTLFPDPCLSADQPEGSCDTYADLNNNRQYDKHTYTVYGEQEQDMKSNPLTFYQPPVITRISPDNGPLGQWVSIVGYNFGQYKIDRGNEDYVYGKIFFYNEAEATLAPCEIGSWSDNLIIAVVPEEAGSGDVYIVTAQQIPSNTKSFTINDKPLGPGLCYLLDENNEFKYNGKPNDFVRAFGDKFGDEQGTSRLVFYDDQTAEVETSNWSNTNIYSSIPMNSQTGDVVVMKVSETGRKCAGFSIGSWCPSGRYDILTEEIPSNPWPINISDFGCEEVSGALRSVTARDLYGSGPTDIFPIETYILEDGQEIPYTSLNLTLLAGDGQYLYAMASRINQNNGTFYGVPGEDTYRTIWQIGTGNPGTDTDLGRVYKRWHFDPSQNLPVTFNWSCSARPWMCQPVYSFVSTKNGLYLGHQMHTFKHYWLPTNDPDYNKEFFGIAKVKFHDCPQGQFTCNYSLEYQEMPQAINIWGNADYMIWPCGIKNVNMLNANNEWWGYVMLTSNGEDVFALSIDLPGEARIENNTCINDNLYKGYTFQVLDGYNWQQKRLFSVKNAQASAQWSSSYFIAGGYSFVADNDYLYHLPYFGVIPIDIQKGEWAANYWNINALYTKETFGFYDWTINKFWFGSYMNDAVYSNVVLDGGKHNRIYRYANCPSAPKGFCRSDIDCWTLGCKNSLCVNGTCTPDIVSFDPQAGSIGTWVTLKGCHFCCDNCGPGKVYLAKDINTSNLSGSLIDRAIARYNFDDAANPGKNSISDKFNGTLVGNAAVANGQLALDGNGDYLDLTGSGLISADTYGGALKGKAAISIWIKPNDFGYWRTIVRRIAGLHYMALNSNGALQIYFFNEYSRTYRGLAVANKIRLNQWNHIVYTIAAESGIKLYVNGEFAVGLDNSAAFKATLATTLGNDSAIGARLSAAYTEFQGIIEDALIYDWDLSAAQVLDLYLSYRVESQYLGPDCKSTWRCSADNNKATYDQVIIEIPNEDTLDNTEDDAITGYIDLITYDKRMSSTRLLAPPDFEVNTDPKGPQICLLEPDYANRGVTFKIIGEKFDEIRQADSYVRFEPQVRLNDSGQTYLREPFTDLNDNGIYDFGDIFEDENKNGKYDPGEPFTDSNNDGQYTEPESYIDLNNNGQYDASGLNPSDYTFNIMSFPAEKPNCPTSGWSDTRICVNVPAAAGGFGTSLGQAANWVSVHKFFDSADQSSNKFNFNVTFGNCGNQKWEPEFGEQCDGLAKDSRITCAALKYPVGCFFECTNYCQLRVCDPVTLICEDVLDLLCGDGEIFEPLEDCDCGEDSCSAEELDNKTCQDKNFTAGTLGCYPPNDGDPKQCKFDTRLCTGPVIGPQVCQSDEDCQIEDCNSKCINNQCAPYIRNFSPDNGALGTWVTVNGCYFGCTPGKVYFSHGFDGLPDYYKNGLVAGYEFTEDGQAIDLTGKYNATLQNGATVAEGSLFLDGVDDHVILGKLNNKDIYTNNGAKGGEITFVAKFKWSPTGNLATLASRFSGMDILVINNNGRLGIWNNYGSSGGWRWSTQTIKPGEWTEIAITMVENNNLKIYINGFLDVEYGNLEVKFNDNKDIDSSLGLIYAGLTEWYTHFNGQIDQVFIFKRILSNLEIDDLYRLSYRQGLLTGCTDDWNCSKECAYGENLGKDCTSDIQCPCAEDDNCPEQRCLPSYTNDTVIIEVPNKNTATENDDAKNSGPVMLVAANDLRDDSQDAIPADYTVNDIDHENICPIDEKHPRVESTNPEDGDGMAAKEAKAVCRNAKLNVFFDSEIRKSTITTDNIIIGVCPEGTVSPNLQARNGIFNKVLVFLKNIAGKLFRLERPVVAQTQSCALLAEDQYSLEIDYDISDKTKVSIVPKALLEPSIVYTVGIIGGENGIFDVQGMDLDYSNSPRLITNLESYVYQFKTMGTPGDYQTGICDVQWIDIKVYRQEPLDASSDPLLAGRASEIRNNDLFICAGKDNCQLVVDYDQDSATSGNQHIYEAEAKYNYSLELRANYQWSKTDALDPQRVISLYNIAATGGDTEPDDFKVRNDTGVTFATAAPIKEAVAKLVIEAQAVASRATPAQKEFIVYLLLCENPWPSINEKFPISSIINAFNFQTYYCRDAGQPGDTSDDLPAARWLAPEEGNLKVLQNTNFEFGNLTYWVEWAGQAFQSQPVFRDLSAARGFAPANIQGAWWVNTFERYRGNPWENINTVQGNEPTGVLSSNAFKIEGNEIKFRIGGNAFAWPANQLGLPLPGSAPANVTAVILATRSDVNEDFIVMRQATGNNASPFTMRDESFDVSTEIGKTGIIYIYDNNTSGFISFDYLRQLSGGREIPIRF